ncbi:hypothetical protein [Candidatus Caldatribacterium sp.]|uniref:hypothetical protein n=1 Tax=Candidatus Caldatribacterium sp. TaxID=2282143 RepID=UPI002994F095|nr:hypothetical protein [Candidatus Caldatribacterium sp.]MDW8081980.1 hypothetical protein [Candidatus Calescibacterium sp.]
MKCLARAKKFMEPLSIILIVFGIFSLCQPFTFFLYHYGFAFLGVGTGLYILFSHVPSLNDLAEERET